MEPLLLDASNVGVYMALPSNFLIFANAEASFRALSFTYLLNDDRDCGMDLDCDGIEVAKVGLNACVFISGAIPFGSGLVAASGRWPWLCTGFLTKFNYLLSIRCLDLSGFEYDPKRGS